MILVQNYDGTTTMATTPLSPGAVFICYPLRSALPGVGLVDDDILSTRVHMV